MDASWGAAKGWIPQRRRGGSARSVFIEALSRGGGFGLRVRRRGHDVGAAHATAKGYGGWVSRGRVTRGRGVVGREGLKEGLRETHRKERRGGGQMRAV